MKKTIALVIGNNKYKGNHDLVNAINDANGIKDVFERLDYEVKYLNDCSNEEFAEALFKLESEIDKYDNAIFYFAGHGFEINGKNYLSSSECDLDEINSQNADITCTDLQKLLDIFKRANTNVNIAIIDACRKYIDRGATNSFTTVIAPKGSIIAFSTSPGRGAKDKGMDGHSIYTGTLLKFIGKEYLSVEALFKKVRHSVFTFTNGNQTSWEHTSLINEFYFNTGQIVYSIKIPYSDNVVKDRDYEVNGGTIDNIISDLKSCNWNKQNPAIDKLLTLDSKSLNKDQLFIIGRNILQASGYAHNATDFIKDLPNVLKRYKSDNQNHLLNGILFEIYFNNNQELRRNGFKGSSFFENIFSLRNNPDFSESFKFINEVLEQYKDEIIYIPNSDNTTIDVIISAKNKEIEYNGNKTLYQLIDKIIISDKDITKEISRLCQSGTNSKNIQDIISRLYLIPKNLVNIVENIAINKIVFEDDLNF